jgi:subtilisin family serine protease
VLLALLTLFSSAVAADKIKITKLDDLPRHVYKITIKAAELLDNEQAVAKLAGEVKRDLLDDLAKYDIEDKTTLKDYYANLGTIAMLEGDFDSYLSYLTKRKELEEKEATRLTMGMVTKAYVLAKKTGSKDFATAYRAELKKLIEPLPYSEVEATLKQTKGGFEMMSKTLTVGSIEAAVQPTLDKSGGEMSKEIALRLLGTAYSVRTMLPLKNDVVAVYSSVIEAHSTKKEDIWAARDVTLTDKDGKAPVPVAIWDSGIDTDIFKGQIWTNSKETLSNNKDDDNNGYVDDVHGIAYSLHSDKETSLLYPIGDVSKDRARLQRQMKGLEDIGSGIDSPEATEFKSILSTIPKDSVKSLWESVGVYGNYCHGTHVAGITANGNPFVRLMAARITFDYHMIPEVPTIELAKKEAKACEETVDYFKKNGVRVVNMSWGGSLQSVEQALEANNAGGTPDERKALSRQIFETTRVALFDAIKNAPDILFITSAGNANNDVNFEEFYPSSFNLPNVLTVGAVDQAGDETSFTSFGKVDVYANGFEVLSYVPGGDKLMLSGTSMSSPNVANLAAKLLAKKSNLTVAQLRDVIVRGCEEKKASERKITLINPKKSFEILSGLK